MKIAIIGEFDANFRPHVATNEAIAHCAKELNYNYKADWIPTDHLEKNLKKIVSDYDAFWIAPGGPFKSLQGVLNLIQYLRKHKIPTLGTCGGFQHIVLEFARNVLDIKDAGHEEYHPNASNMVVDPLRCDLKGEPLEVDIIDKTSRTFEILKSDKLKEKYYCSFGLNPKYQELFDRSGFKIVGSDKHKEARILELESHPFFIATLFVPQDNSSEEQPHPIITEFLKVASKE